MCYFRIIYPREDIITHQTQNTHDVNIMLQAGTLYMYLHEINFPRFLSMVCMAVISNELIKKHSSRNLRKNFKRLLACLQVKYSALNQQWVNYCQCLQPERLSVIIMLDEYTDIGESVSAFC